MRFLETMSGVGARGLLSGLYIPYFVTAFSKLTFEKLVISTLTKKNT
jgi:predicted nucleotide-binding protein (sugar kinase/HSP70/actin superfamily)